MEDRLNKTLKQWSDRHQPDEDRLQVMSRRIVTAAAEDRYHGTVNDVDPGVLWWERLRGAAVGAAVALLVATYHFRSVQSTDPEQTSNGPAVSFAAMSPQRLSHVRRLYADFESEFSDRLRWVSQSKGYVGLGIAGEEEVVDASEPVLVRLVVVASPVGADVWQRVWHADVVVRSGEVTQVIPNKDADNSLKLLVYRRSDGRVSVGTHLELQSPVKLSSEQMVVLTANAPAEVLELEKGGKQYRVLQSVRPLDA